MPVSPISNVDLKLLRVFMAVARVGGFSLAQTELNVSQATISIHIKSLETRLGVTLCQRGRSGFALTEDGQRVYDAANALFNHIEDFRSVVLGSELLVGELQIGIIDNTVSHPNFSLSKVIEEFGKLQHDVDISVHVAPPNRLERMVISGQVHLAIGYFPRRLSQLTYTPAFKASMELYCGHKHPLFKKNKRSITITDVESSKHAQRGYVSMDQAPEKQRTFTYTARAHSIEGLAHLILSGQYLAFLPTHYAQQWVSEYRMRSILKAEYSYESIYEIIRRNRTSRTPAETKFYNLMQSILGTKPNL